MERIESQMRRLDLQEAEEGDVFDSVDTQPVDEHEEEAAEQADSDYSPDDMTCAICLERTDLTDIALVKGCEHQYCVHCILQWAMCKEWCPQCKKPFDYLLTHRQLDGTLTDYLTEESVVLLKRARWFEDHVKEKEQGRIALQALQNNSSAAAYAATAAAAEDGTDARDWADYYEDYVDAELEEDEEIEQYYFSSAAGRARVVLGNRRWGEGGYMRAGRMYARPATHRAAPNASGGKTDTAAPGKITKAATAPTKGKTAGSGSSSKGTSSGAAAAADGAGGAGGFGGAGSSSSSSAATAVGNRSASSSRTATGAGSSAAAAAASSSSAAAGPSSSSSSKSRGRTTSIAAWLDEDDEDDFSVHDYDGDYFTSSGGGRNGNRRGCSSSNSRSRSRPDRPARMVKPLRQVPKNSPACCAATGPVAGTPLGKSPGGGSFTVGSWGASGSGGGSLGASPPLGSTPGSGRRAKRNARRAAYDAEGVGGGYVEWD